MKAIVIDQYGGKEELKEREMPKPTIMEGEVLIELHATSVNPIDWKLREGYLKEMLPFDFPIILGWDAAGIVSEIGSNVSTVSIGDRVFVRPETTAQGTYAEYIVTEEKLLAKIPDNITFEEAAAVPLAGLTAYQCLVNFTHLNKGDKVLIHAGSGGVGSLGIQIAKSLGYFVATTGSKKNEEFLKSIGADIVIKYDQQDFEQELKEYDLVVDTMGGDIQDKSFQVLKKGGTLVSIVQPPDEIKAEKMDVNAKYHWLIPNGEQLKKLADLMEKGKLKPVVGSIFEFSEQGVREAHVLSESHHAKGKIVIKIK
ncbi:NADP-dependent oxidoreductase [Heyndrickxia oleronia]|jgi:2-desacetyl-2-hydroxyethyl bacteriochlorophyllide A dehydrogenase|uniref:NADP-dependent oxidoreductase n=1 Tax=Heyndrickxia oleronia TaxID=38875 RepID=UPI002432D6D4|nr:NADP-dependent oxidoreductase [Heyndrickxia oleronia]MCI1591512.1 NADP-dependent oxidoreductase [Heyndrickxia oleronia]MCI1614352.1 NADP-dependent oxidoreductase [Heyndrickxia oleronia]MCI1745426.1 NADP-dependent oxidoreductase [Heyndrickxia oleronia]MCI1762233.1 NADP-dependent oxidoreductase [Heyndrickxia oleronia]